MSMTDNPFATPPPPGSGIKWDDLNGQLILVEPVAIEVGIKTAFGDSDAVRADIAVLSGDGKGDTYTDTLVFPKVLQGQLKGSIGKKVLGRIGQGTAKPGQSAPWMLLDPQADDIEVGKRYLEHRAANAISQPAPAEQPAATGGSSVPF